MRNVMLLLLGVAACRPAASARLDKAADDTPAVLTDAERQRMEDSAKAWLAMTERQWEQGDSAGLMGTYPPSGPIVSAFDGQLVTAKDSAAAMLAGLSKVAGRKVTYGDPRIDVVAPGVVAVTLPTRFEGTNPGEKHFDVRNMYSVVLAERDDHLRIIQEHASTVRLPEK